VARGTTTTVPFLLSFSLFGFVHMSTIKTLFRALCPTKGWPQQPRFCSVLHNGAINPSVAANSADL